MYQLNRIVPVFDIRCHKNCIDNLEKSVLERVFYVKSGGRFITPPLPRRGVFTRRLKHFAGTISRFARTSLPLSPEEFLVTVPSGKRRAYEEAFTSLQHSPIRSEDAHVKVFIKYEKEIFEKKSPVPRCISPRSYRFLFSDGQFYHAIEKQIMEDIDQVFNEPTVMKGLTVEGVANAIVDKWNSIPDCVAIGVDATRFDQHCSVDALKWQHSVQARYFAGENRSRYMRLQRMKLRNIGTGRTPDGVIKFSTNGKRMSGDMDTGGGNVLLMCAMMYAYFRSLNLPHGAIKLINNGDDCVIFVSRKYEGLVRKTLDPWFLEMGYNMVCEPTAHIIEQVEFCQMRPVNVNGEWRMVRNPKRAIPKDCTSIRRIDIPKVYQKWTKAVGECGLALTGGVPVFQEWYTSCMGAKCPTWVRSKSRRVQQRESRRTMDDDSGLYKWRPDKPYKYANIHYTTRLSFYYAFGITPEEQIHLETFIKSSGTHWGEVSEFPRHNPSPLFLLLY